MVTTEQQIRALARQAAAWFAERETTQGRVVLLRTAAPPWVHGLVAAASPNGIAPDMERMRIIADVLDGLADDRAAYVPGARAALVPRPVTGDGVYQAAGILERLYTEPDHE